MIPVRNNGESHPVAEGPHHEEQPIEHAVRDVAAQALRNPMGEAADIEEAEELQRKPLSIEQVMALPEQVIRNLSSEQLAEVDRFFSNHTYDLFELIRQQPGEIADKWALKLYALGSNEFFARDGIHAMVICALIDGIRNHNLHEHSRRQFVALNTNQEALDRQDEAFDQLAERQRRNQEALDKMTEDLQEIERRLLAEQEAPPPVDPHDVIADQYVRPQAADAVDRRDDPHNDGWHPCWLIAAIIGCLAVAYGWFRGSGDTPTKG